MNNDYLDQVRPTLLKAIVLLSVLAFGALIAGCSSGDGGSETPPPSQEPPPQNTPPNPSGLDARPSNTTCVAPERATGSATIGTERVFPKLRFRNHAIEMLQAPGDSSRWFVAERFGFVQVFDNKPDVAATSDIPRHRRARRLFMRRMRPARHGVSPRFPRHPARLSDVHQPESHHSAGRTHTSRNSPRATAGSRWIPIPSASSSRSAKSPSITMAAALASAADGYLYFEHG